MHDAIKTSALLGGLLLAGAIINAAAIVRHARADEPGDPRTFYRQQSTSTYQPVRHHRAHREAGVEHVSGDPRPAAWCGWYLRRALGVADRTYNRAIAWARYGQPASGPASGVIAVWPHHVGLVTSVPGPGRIVLKSGNDGHAVRERERSTRGVVAWRIP